MDRRRRHEEGQQATHEEEGHWHGSGRGDADSGGANFTVSVKERVRTLTFQGVVLIIYPYLLQYN